MEFKNVYKPDSDDYCRNCHMASYNSSYITLKNVKEDELIKNLIDLL